MFLTLITIMVWRMNQIIHTETPRTDDISGGYTLEVPDICKEHNCDLGK